DFFGDNLSDGVAVGGADLRHQHVVATGRIQRLDRIEIADRARRLDVPAAVDLDADQCDRPPRKFLRVDIRRIPSNNPVVFELVDVLSDGGFRYTRSVGDGRIGSLRILLQDGED